MRIHELLDQPLTDYMQQLSENFSLDEVSWYRYKPTVKPQLKRAMQVARKTTSRIKKTGGKVKSIAKRAGRSATKAAAAAANAMKQQAAQKQKQTAQASQAATAYQPIKYPKQMVMPKKQHGHKLNLFSSPNLHLFHPACPQNSMVSKALPTWERMVT